VRVLEEGVAHLLLDVDVDDALLHRFVRRGGSPARAAWHTSWYSSGERARTHTGRLHLGLPRAGGPDRPTAVRRPGPLLMCRVIQRADMSELLGQFRSNRP